MKNHAPKHELLFDEICGKLNELTHKTDDDKDQERWSERLQKMQQNLRLSQEELKATQSEIQDKIKSLDSMNFLQNDLTQETQKWRDQLDQERTVNSKLSTDLAKSLELNLKLQFEIEEIRSKASNVVQEERKLNQFLNDKNRALTDELDLAQALQNETRLELNKAKDCFSSEQRNWNQEKIHFENHIKELELEVDTRSLQVEELTLREKSKNEEIQELNQTLEKFEDYVEQQNGNMKNLSGVAEKKLIELKLALDKKIIESQGYYSHIQQALTQIQVLRQENTALKEYIGKLTSLNQMRANENGL